MSSATFETRLNDHYISGDYYPVSDKQHEKISLTSRKAFSSKSSRQSRSGIMQQVSDKCQSVQVPCRRKIQQRSGCFQTHNTKSSNASHFPTRDEAKIKRLLHTTSPPNSFHARICNHQDIQCHPCRTRNMTAQKYLNKKREVPKNLNMHAVVLKDRYCEKSNTCENMAGTGSTSELRDVTKPDKDSIQRRQLASNNNAASPVGYRIKRLRTSPATAAAATTTAWVNTLIISWLVVQELFLVCPPCHARSTTAINAGNPDAKRLYDDLLSNYNKLVRPVVNTTDALQVMIKLKLSQLIDVVSGLNITTSKGYSYDKNFFLKYICQENVLV